MKATTKYYIDFIASDCNGKLLDNPYWVFVRTRDEAILMAHSDIDTIFAECWKRGYNQKDVVIL